MKKSMKDVVLTMVMLCGVAFSANADTKWVDVTNEFITNPRFEITGNSGWFVWNWGGSSQCRNGCQAFSGCWFEISQQLSDLPLGHYRLSMQGFYRTEDNALAYRRYNEGTVSDEEMAVLFAYTDLEGYTVPLASVYSADHKEAMTGAWTSGDGQYFPNNIVAARAFFDLGFYENQLEFNADGYASIGVFSSEQKDRNWCVVSNFKLEMEGEMILATGLSLQLDTKTLVVGQTVNAKADIQPENVLFKRLIWSSSDEKVATVDRWGYITALDTGTATITAQTTDGSNITAAVTVTVIHNKPTKESLIINEVMASNVDEYISPATNFDSWVELYNPTDLGVELAGMWLSDNADNLRLWKMPADATVLPGKGYALLWFDSNNVSPTNAPFKLDTDGGTLFISDEDGRLLTQVDYPEGMERISYARTTDGGDTWGTTSTPTPWADNATATYAATQLQAPEVNQPSQLFNGTLSVSVTIPAGTTLRYTTNGTLPTPDNGEVSKNGRFTVKETANYRFRLFADDRLASPVTTRSYIQRAADFSDLPILSVVTDDAFLYDDYLGVFVQGYNGRPGNGQSEPCNWNMDWERPVNFSYLDTKGQMVFNQDVNLEMCGGWSRAWSPHSFKLKGSKELGGNKNLDFPFFEQKPYIRNRTLQIRNGGNDNGCRIKDASLQYIVGTSGFNIDYQSYQPVHEFINGRYIGVLNMREPNNKHYVYANYGWDDDEIDQFEISPDSNYVQKCGTPDAYEELLALSENAADADTYNEICNHLLDIDAYANYMALELYLGNNDWPKNNIKGFRHRNDGKFRFVVFDLDHSFNSSNAISDFMNKERWQFDQLYPTSLGRRYEQITFVTLFKNLLANADFRRRFIDAFCIVGGSVLQTDRASEIIDALVAHVNPAMRLNGESASQTANQVKSNLRGRLNSATNYLKQYRPLGLTSTAAQQVKLESDAEGAQLLINGQPVPTGTFNGRLFQPVTLKAVAPAGYTFKGWQTADSKKFTYMGNGATWSYYDQGSLDGTNWTSPTYDETGWKTGNAPVGYGKPDVKSTVDYGGDAQNKRPTCYLRTTVNLDEQPGDDDKLSLNYTVDDGMIVYVNGNEAGRYNMPQGNATYNTFATTNAQSNPDVGTLTLKGSLFHKGSNVIAVELHNNSATSTDLEWDASLTMTVSTGDEDLYSTEPTIDLPAGNVYLKAVYRPMTDSELRQQGVTPVRVNEVSASNDAYVNSYGKKGDWVELYNTTAQPLDIKGMYFTDNLEKPQKYQVEQSAVIPAHGHILIWCDKLEPTANELHAPFKISGDGGVIAISAADNSWSDTLYYSAHDANYTIGRYPDGCADVYAMNMPTIGLPNMLTSYVTEVAQHNGNDSGVQAIAANGGFRVRYGAGQLIVKGDASNYAAVEVFTLDGRLVERISVTLQGGTARADVSQLTPGCYVARATDNNGQTVSCKFLK